MGMAAMGAVLAGAFAGNATVASMASLDISYALPLSGDERQRLAEAEAERQAEAYAAAHPATPVPVQYPVSYHAAPPEPDCVDCGDYAEGYRWAASRRLDDESVCAGDSWSFTRGCAAYVAGDAPPA
jgi:hypothetical protein